MTRNLSKSGRTKNWTKNCQAPSKIIPRQRWLQSKSFSQEIKCKPSNCGKILVDKTLVIDDEKYFTLSNSEISGNDGYYTDNKQTAPNDVKYKKNRKFEPNVLVWIAILEDDMSIPYIHKSRVAIDANVYINKFLMPNLVPFIK